MAFDLKPLFSNKLIYGLYLVYYQSKKTELFSLSVNIEAVYLVDNFCFKGTNKCRYFISWVLYYF